VPSDAQRTGWDNAGAPSDLESDPLSSGAPHQGIVGDPLSFVPGVATDVDCGDHS